MPESRAWRVAHRLGAWGRWLILGGVFAVAVIAPTSFVAVEQTSQPAFCNSCHIMEPYYESWEHSAHNGIKCIECHFEPGTMGTVQGKFQAISQLAKYVTRTAGTRPWAEVSDASCMRSGCHSMSSLEGPVEFGRVSFDHRPHLLEARGKRLRCVTCHSQVLVGEHFAVEPAVCFTCHFMPDDHGHVPERTSDCTLCHGPPDEAVTVAGRPFDHAEYLARGVTCRECHANVVEGDGTVHLQRCRSCHGQPELLAQSGDAELMHRAHVTERKVECFECHVEIAHGSDVATFRHPTDAKSCSTCHATPHDAARLVFAGEGGGSGAAGPSRMLETHVACEACHTGRSAGRAGAAAPEMAAAGEVDCLHCHGTAFAGMLAEWQAAIGGGAEGLGALADELDARLAGTSDAEAAVLRDEARGELELLARDGSRGAHNAPFALDVLRTAAQRLDSAWTRLDPAAAPRAAALLPPETDAACRACHLDVTRHDPLSVHSRPFAHGPHLRAAGLACSTCHAGAPHGSDGHGAPAFPREQCATCHHTESERLDPADCTRCHGVQDAFFTGAVGAVAGLADAPVTMADKDCASCHGEPPDLVIPPPSMCVLCHEEGYDGKLAQWQGRTDELVRALQAALAAAPEADAGARAKAEAALELVAADGSRGVHNAALAERLLAEALAALGAR